MLVGRRCGERVKVTAVRMQSYSTVLADITWAGHNLAASISAAQNTWRISRIDRLLPRDCVSLSSHGKGVLAEQCWAEGWHSMLLSSSWTAYTDRASCLQHGGRMHPSELLNLRPTAPGM